MFVSGHTATSVTASAATLSIIHMFNDFVIYFFLGSFWVIFDLPHFYLVIFSPLACTLLVSFCLTCIFFIQPSVCFYLVLFTPVSVSGATIIYCLYFYSFSIHFRDHLTIILNVSVGFLSFLLYLFLFRLSLCLCTRLV